jgi:hypothetical protein
VVREMRNYPKWRPFPLEIAADDFSFAAGHRRIAISFVAGTLNSAARLLDRGGFVQHLDLAQADGSAGGLVDVPPDRRR